MAQDKYYGKEVQLSDPANEARPVTMSDTVDLGGGEPCRGLYVGTGGTVVMLGTDDTAARTWLNVPNGALIPFRAKRVMLTGTTASNILALY